MSTRPRLNIPLTLLDWLLEGLTMLLMAWLIWSLIDAYGSLPDTIPTHFNHEGQADGFGSKSTLWLLPSIGFAMYIVLLIVNRSPHRFNYTVDITETNAAYQYALACRLIRVINLSVVATFWILSREMILGAQEAPGQLGGYLLPMILFLTLSPIIVYLILSALYKS